LDKIIASVDLTLDDVYIANVVKCRPPGNRTPLPAEAEACKPYLREQTRIIRPRIMICLGAAAAQLIIDPKAKITQIRGKWIERGSCRIMPTFHPAALLRDPAKKRPVWEDMQAVRDYYLELKAQGL